ncbi:MAG: response regulator [Desulfotignum sp.]|nr:response regulator [Desulfotignum sp.]MCF8112323.1 response regulator [Desulfotignum sp.]MCF8125875.1 response regulator [Desulfotignum sp.]
MQYLSAILPLFSAIIFLGLGCTVYFLSRGRLRRVFLRFSYITFHWQISWFAQFALDSPVYADLICRIGYSGIIFLPVSVYETVLTYLKLPPKGIKAGYMICCVFLFFLWTTDWFIKGAYSYDFGFYPEAGFLHLFYLLMILVIFLQNTHLFFLVYQAEKNLIKKRQLLHFLTASILFSFASIDYLLNYPVLVKFLDIKLYPVGVFFLIFSVLIFVLSHFITLNLTLENRVSEKTRQLKTYVDALEAADDLKKNLIANVTHELRTPLTLIRGWVDYLLEGESGQVSQKMTDVIDKINLQTLALTEKINELLKVSKFDAGMARLVLTRTDLNGFVSRIVTEFQGLADQSGIQLVYQGPNDGTPMNKIYIDTEKLKDILNNLIRNAYKFTEKGSIAISLAQKSQNVVIQVSDTGIGMSEDFVQKAFHRFTQGDGGRARLLEGTGLGLAIVKESVDLMHGRVTVESAENKGTTFTVTLPRNLRALEPSAHIEKRKNDRRKKNLPISHQDRRKKGRREADYAGIDNTEIIKISSSAKNLSSMEKVQKHEAENARGCLVIAEDNKGIQELLAAALKDYTLFITANGRTAWQTIEQQMPDLVLSDVMMPIMDGYELVKNIRSHETTKNIPVIIITALANQDDRIHALQIGADDFLTKPFHHVELQARVRNVISLRALFRERTRVEQLETFLMVLASAIESKDLYTGGHVERVANYARDLSRRKGLSEQEANQIYLGSIVHDVGKIGIKDEILNKPGKLIPEEFEIIKTHPSIGKKLLSKLEIAPVAVNIAYNHQEKWDGTGYPRGIAGKKIPLEARIATVADFWDAITSDRPYRQAMPLAQAVSIMYEEKGRTFDPELLDLFMDEQHKLYLKYLNDMPEKV